MRRPGPSPPIGASSRSLSATPDRQLLLFLDEQRGVRIWDLKERTCRRLHGTYRAGAFIDDDRLVLIPDSNAADHAGRLVLVDRSGLRVATPILRRQGRRFHDPRRDPVRAGGRLAGRHADRRGVRLRQGSRWSASGTRSSGRLTHWITTDRFEDAVLALAFSGDGRYLLTGGDSPVGTALGPLGTTGRAGRPGRHLLGPDGDDEPSPAPRSVPDTPSRWSPATATARSTPGGGTASGMATLEVPRLVAREFATAVKALCFTSDGRYLAAAGDGKRIWVGAMEPRPQPGRRCWTGSAPHHDEQINAPSPGAWRGDRPILISGGDDTTIRFWDLEGRALRGTFSAGNRPAVAGAARRSRSSIGSSTRPTGGSTPRRRPRSWSSTGARPIARRPGAIVAASRASWRSASGASRRPGSSTSSTRRTTSTGSASSSSRGRRPTGSRSPTSPRRSRSACRPAPIRPGPRPG